MKSEILRRYDMTVDDKFMVPVSVPNYRSMFEALKRNQERMRRQFNHDTQLISAAGRAFEKV
jgi:hypothetical protein